MGKTINNSYSVPKPLLALGPQAVWLWLTLSSEAEADGQVRISQRTFAKRIGMSYQVLRSNLAKLLDTPFLSQLDSEVCTRLTISDTPQTTNTKASGGTPAEAIDFEGFMQFFNHNVGQTGISKIRSLSKSRKAAVAARCREYGKQEVINAIHRVVASDFLSGRSDRGFHIGFDWIFKPINFQKIIEGTYDNRQRPQTAGAASRQAEFTEYVFDKLRTPDGTEADLSGNY